MTLAYGFPEIASLRPQGLHQWRQADCLSITSNYAQDNYPFLRPQLHYQTQVTNGEAMSEFPLMYWLNGQLWKQYGTSEPLYRGIVFGLFFLALFRLHLQIRSTGKVASIIIPAALFTSPILAYYSFNFISNVPAFSFALLGATYLYNYRLSKRLTPLLVAMLFIGLAGLLKITSIAFFLTVVAALIASRQYLQLPHKRAFLFSTFGLFILWFFWYRYASNYNAAIEHKPFLIGILPYWELTAEARQMIWTKLGNWWFPRWLPLPLGIFSILSSIGLLFAIKRLPRFLWFLNVFQLLGWIAYLTLFFQVFDNHDYYLINSLVWPLTTWLILFYWSQKWVPTARKALVVLSALFVVSGTYWAAKQNTWAITGWRNPHLTKTIDFETIEPWLREKGIEQNDLVLVLPDRSINISLYLMNQKGWTRFYTGLDNTGDINERIVQGAKYLFVHSDEWMQKEYLQPFMLDTVGQYGHIAVFKLPE